MLTSSSSASRSSSLEPMFCPFCGVALCQRKWNPFRIPFSCCHACGAPTVCSLRPSQNKQTQTPAEWAAFVDEGQRGQLLSDALHAFAEQATHALETAEIRDDIQSGFALSPKTTRQKLYEVVKTHEDAMLHMKRVHEAELRTLKSQLAVADSVNGELNESMQNLQRAVEHLQKSLALSQQKIDTARQEAASDTDSKWKLVQATEAQARADRERELSHAWKILYNSVIPRNE